MSFWEPQGFAGMRTLFANQFENEDGCFVYRKSGKGFAIPITGEEHTVFLETYDRYLARQRWHMYAWLLGPLVLLTLVGLAFMATGYDLSEQVIYGSIAVAIGPGLIQIIVANRRAMAAPMQILKDRLPVAPARTRPEASRASIAKLSWGSLAGALGGAAWIAFKFDLYDAPWQGSHKYWSITVVALVSLVGVQALRKLLVDTRA